MSVTAEVMDCAFGCPAEGVPVTLLREIEACWQEPTSGVTDEAGRVPVLLTAAPRGRYRLGFDFDKYFAALGVEPFQSQVDVTFRIHTTGDGVHLVVAVTPWSIVVTRTSTSRPAGLR
jgi:5-hydroxyisourate hydrolase